MAHRPSYLDAGAVAGDQRVIPQHCVWVRTYNFWVRALGGGVEGGSVKSSSTAIHELL